MGEQTNRRVQTTLRSVDFCSDSIVPGFYDSVRFANANSVGLGAVLTQAGDDGEHVIAFASRAMSAPEKKYSVTKQECLAVVWAIQKF